MLAGLTLLLCYQLAGEVLVLALGLPIPGPVLGMVLLFVMLLVRGGLAERLRPAAAGLLQHLSLLFVPAGVGVMVHYGRIAGEWLAVGAALLASTVLSLGLSALLAQALARGTAAEPDRSRSHE
jgi:holin-like protein